jgi:hypothetical protein
MDVLMKEYEEVVNQNYCLSFTYPEPGVMDKMDNTYGDKSEEQRNELATSFEQIKELKKCSAVESLHWKMYLKTFEGYLGNNHGNKT